MADYHQNHNFPSNLKEQENINIKKINKRKLINKYEFAMVLGAAADIICSVASTNVQREGKKLFDIYHDKFFSGKFGGLRIQSNTEMHLATAKAILDPKGTYLPNLDVEIEEESDQEYPFKSRQNYNLYGKGFYSEDDYLEHVGSPTEIINAYEESSFVLEQLDNDMKTSNETLGYDESAFGCEPAVRSMCIGMRFPGSPKKIRKESFKLAKLTHNHPIACCGAFTTAYFTFLAIEGYEILAWGSKLLDVLKRRIKKLKDHQEIEQWNIFIMKWTSYLSSRGILDGKSLPVFPVQYDFKDRDLCYESICGTGWAGASGIDAPIIAYDALLRGEKNWEKVLEGALFHGGRVDATASIAGCWFGILYGLEHVSYPYYGFINNIGHIIEVSKELFKAADAELDKKFKAKYCSAMVLGAVCDAFGSNILSLNIQRNSSRIATVVKNMGGIKSIDIEGKVVSRDDKRVGSSFTNFGVKWFSAIGTKHFDTAKILVELTREYGRGRVMQKFKDMRTDTEIHKQIRAKFTSTEITGPKKSDPQCCSGGAAIRAICIGLFYPNHTELVDLINMSIQFGKLTHKAPQGYLGSMISAVFTHFAIQGYKINSWGNLLLQILDLRNNPKLKETLEEKPSDWDEVLLHWRKYVYRMHKRLDEKLECEEIDEFQETHDCTGEKLKEGCDATMLAYDALLKAEENWEKLSRRAFFHGGNCRFIGPIAAFWFGLIYGSETVPVKNRKGVFNQADLVSTAVDILNLVPGSTVSTYDLSGKDFNLISCSHYP